MQGSQSRIVYYAMGIQIGAQGSPGNKGVWQTAVIGTNLTLLRVNRKPRRRDAPFVRIFLSLMDICTCGWRLKIITIGREWRTADFGEDGIGLRVQHRLPRFILFEYIARA